MCPQIVKKPPIFYGARRFITAFTRNRHLSPSLARAIQSMPSIPLLKDSYTKKKEVIKHAPFILTCAAFKKTVAATLYSWALISLQWGPVFWVVVHRWLIVTDVSEQPNSTIFKVVPKHKVINYQQSLRNIPEERSPHLHHGESLKSRKSAVLQM